MARKSDIQYVQFYMDGSAARELELEPRRQKKKLQQPRPRSQK